MSGDSRDTQMYSASQQTMSGDTQTLSNNPHRTVENAYKLSEDTSDGYYLQPKQLTANSVTRSDESGIGSLSGNSGNVNPAFLSSPESEFETSFCADGRSPYSPIDCQAMDFSLGSNELDLPPPPAPDQLWSLSDDAFKKTEMSVNYVAGQHSPHYVYPMKLQGPQSNYCMEPRLPTTPLQPLATQLSYEGQQQVLKHRLHSDGGDNHNIYEEMRDVGKSHSFRKTTKDLTNRPLPNTGYAGSERKQFDEVEEGTDYSAYSVPPGPGIKKYNPLYGEISSTEKRESLDKKLRDSHMSSSPSVVNIKRDNSCNKCSCGISLLAILVSLAAMAIVLLTATNTISLASDLSSTGAIGVSSAITSQSEFDKLAQNITELYARLESQANLNNELSATIASLQMRNDNLTQLASNLQRQVEGSSNNTDSTFSGINSSLLLFESQLTDVTSNISRVHQSLFDFITNVSNSVPSQGPKGEQGPQGATGFINVSLCSHRRNLRILSSRTALTQVVLDSSQEKIIAATCSFNKYTAATLKTSTQNSFNTYQCSCTTIESTAPSDGECAINYWACALPASV